MATKQVNEWSFAQPLTYLKAILAALGSFVSAAIGVLNGLPEGSNFGDINTVGWLTILGAVIATFAIVFGVPNFEKNP